MMCSNVGLSPDYTGCSNNQAQTYAKAARRGCCITTPNMMSPVCMHKTELKRETDALCAENAALNTARHNLENILKGTVNLLGIAEAGEAKALIASEEYYSPIYCCTTGFSQPRESHVIKCWQQKLLSAITRLGTQLDANSRVLDTLLCAIQTGSGVSTCDDMCRSRAERARSQGLRTDVHVVMGHCGDGLAATREQYSCR